MGTAFERVLYMRAFVYMLIIRFWMLFIRFSWYEKYFGKRFVESTTPFPMEKLDVVQSIRKAVAAISNNTPWESKCMVQAITGKWLLHQQGIPSTLYFGIGKNDSQKTKLAAHAWLRVGDKIIIGKDGHKTFKVVNYYS